MAGLNPFGGEKYKMEIVPDVPPSKLYDEGLGRIKSSDYEGAAKKFSQIDKQHPQSEWSRKALIMSAYANYEGKRWEEAINDSKRYIQLHPSSKDTAYAYYLLAMSHFNQIPDVTRDQERSEKALAALQELVTNIPSRNTCPTPGTASRLRAIRSPAIRWRSAASTFRSGTTRARSTASGRSWPNIRPRAMSRKR